jgi:hypothetical protein
MALSAKEPNPENILKTKGRKRGFLLAKPENILKKSHLQESMEFWNSRT